MQMQICSCFWTSTAPFAALKWVRLCVGEFLHAWASGRLSACQVGWILRQLETAAAGCHFAAAAAAAAAATARTNETKTDKLMYS